MVTSVPIDTASVGVASITTGSAASVATACPIISAKTSSLSVYHFVLFHRLVLKRWVLSSTASFSKWRKVLLTVNTLQNGNCSRQSG